MHAPTRPRTTKSFARRPIPPSFAWNQNRKRLRRKPTGLARNKSSRLGARPTCDDHAVGARETDRLRTLLETGLAISSELSIDAVLQKIVEAAALVTGARYA